jgi:hypothetical protein
MQVVHTEAEPPNQGKIILPIKGCTWKSKNALKKIVRAYANTGARVAVFIQSLEACRG